MKRNLLPHDRLGRIGRTAFGAILIAVAFGMTPPSRAADQNAPIYLTQPAPAPAMTPATAGSAPADARSVPDATVRLSGGQVAVGIGYSWGDGTLDYRGSPHSFRIAGISVANVGASSINATGNVYNLKRLDDFNGTYAAVEAGATVGGGGSVAYLRNQNGVVIKLTSTQEGFDFQLSGNGMKVALE